MKDNSFDKNLENVINNNPEDQKKTILIDSQEDLVEHLKSAHNHEGGYIRVDFGIGKYLIYNENGDDTITGVKLFDMLCDGVIAPNAITNLDEIFKYKDVIEDFDNLQKFLYWFYERDFNGKNIGNCELVKKGDYYASKTDLENAVSAFNTEQLNQNPTKYIINLVKQKDSLKRSSYTQEDPLENYLLKKSVDDISDLKNLLNEGQKTPWSKLAPVLCYRSIKELNTLKEMAVFDENNKISADQTLLFANKSVGNWQELFEMCDDNAKHGFIFSRLGFYAFKDGAFKGFDLNDTKTLKEYGLIKKSRLMYLLYALWDIRRIIVWAISFGKYCKYKHKCGAWFEKTGELYKENCKIEDVTKRIKENQEKGPVSEQPEEVKTEEDKNKNNLELTNELNGFKPKTSNDKNQNQNQNITDDIENMK